MPIYRFEFRDGDIIRVVEDAELPHDQAACDEALRSATDLLIEAKLQDETRTGWAARAYRSGQLLTEVDFSDVDLGESELKVIAL
jgi:hypothetical protein